MKIENKLLLLDTLRKEDSMNGKKIAIGIVGAMLVGGITQAASYYPNLVGVFTPASAMVLGAVAFFNGADNND